MKKKIIITESQLVALERHIDEARAEKGPTSLKAFFDDNPTAKYFSVVQRLKGGSDTDYWFEILTTNGGKSVKDINKGGSTKGCSGDLRLDTVLYGSQFKMPFGSCGNRVINNVVGLNLYSDEQSLKSGQQMDSFEIEHDLDKTSTEMIDKYYEQLKNLNTNNEVYFDSKIKWDGVVIRKTNDNVDIELYQHGIPLSEVDMSYVPKGYEEPTPEKGVKPKTKSKNRAIILRVDLKTNPFYEENGQIMFKGTTYNRDSGEATAFNIPIKNFDVTSDEVKSDKPERTPKGMDDPKDVKTPEELRKEAERAYDMILNDPLLRQAFYKKPSFWNLFVSELKGKKAPGTGILPTLQILDSYGNKMLNDNLGAEFMNGGRVIFSPYNAPISIPYQDKTFQLNVGTPYNAIVRDYTIGDKNKVIENRVQKFRVVVKTKTDTQDVYRCDVIKYIENKDGTGVEDFPQQDVYLKFSLEGGGYRPIQTDNEPKEEPNN